MTGIYLEAVIDAWIRAERYTEKEFGRLAAKAETPMAKNTYQYLSDAGRRHAEMLGYVLALASDEEKAVPIQTFTPPVIPEAGSRTYRSSVEEIYYSAGEHMDLELGMSRAYAYLSRIVKSRDAIQLLHSLAEEEKMHHRQLQALMHAFEDVYRFLKKS